MSEPIRIKIEDADFATLKHFAEAMLGIEVKHGTNSATVRGAILKAAPEIKDIPAIQVAPAMTPPPAPAPVIVAAPGEDPAARPAAVSLPASAELQHASRDPKVEILIHKTADKSRARDVTVGVNGDIFRMQRGERMEVPYRVYLALNDAMEKAAIETDQINPFTGEPVMGWSDVQSYPFTVFRMPAQSEIDSWLQASGAGFKVAA